jgi:hypothetical protein
MELAVTKLPSFDDLDASLHGLVQLASHAGHPSTWCSMLLARASRGQ